MPQPDDGQVLAHRVLAGGDDDLAPGCADRSAPHPRVGGERDRGHALDRAFAGERAPPKRRALYTRQIKTRPWREGGVRE